MDFKVAGTQNGITGIQLDLKIDGISAGDHRGHAGPSPRGADRDPAEDADGDSAAASRDFAYGAAAAADARSIRKRSACLIGPGGKTIRGIQEATGAVIEVDDDGTVTIASGDAAGAKAAMDAVEALTAAVQVGRIYEGRVTSVKDFGAFVEILPGKDGLCHISELSDEYVSSVGDVVQGWAT